jgi:precorrin-6A synthase
VLVIGVGAGDPDYMTVAAIEALNRASVVFELDRATRDLTLAREALVERYARGKPPRTVVVAEPRRDRAAERYAEAVHDWRAGRAAAWERAIEAELGAADCGAFLVWGDPSLYDSTIAVLEDVLAAGRVEFEFEVIPGISSLHALTARHRIALNRVAGAVLITTGRLLAAGGWPDGIDDVAVMLDAGGSFRVVIDKPCDIYWGAYLGTPDELLVAGRLVEVADQIDRLRAGARERKGWVMDTYLLRRR